MVQVAAAKFARLLLLLVVGFAIVLIGNEAADELRRSPKKGRLVATIVREQFSRMGRLPAADHILIQEKSWPADFPVLRNWLIHQVVRGESPQKIASRLTQMAAGKDLSPTLRITIDRWRRSLNQWASGGSVPRAELLAEGRRRYLEASGYEKVERAFDATVLYLWSVRLLSQYIETDSEGLGIAEATYLLGVIDIRLKRLANMETRGDRLLLLCQELFPDSVWAEKAETLWRSESGHDV